MSWQKGSEEGQGGLDGGEGPGGAPNLAAHCFARPDARP